MTERGLPIVDGAPACPFVAFDDDRDERAASPDHRHRCYAEPNPAPRALAHQEAYCLSSAFPVCPTFQDWARREAARSRNEPPERPTDAVAALAAAPTPQRNPPRNWAAPPPWMSRADAERGQESLWDEDGDDGEDVEVAAPAPEIPRRGRGLSGSYADRVASDAVGAAGAAAGAAGAGTPEMPWLGDADGPEDVAEVADIRSARPAPSPAPTPDGPEWPGAAERRHPDGWDDEQDEGPTPPPVRRRRERDVSGVAAIGGGTGRGSGGSDGRGSGERSAGGSVPGGVGGERRRRDNNAPEWERARPMEAYPTLRSRRLSELSIPPLLVGIVALALAAAVLFALPGLLGFGNPSAGGSPTPTLAVQTPLVTQAPTPVPQPTDQIYLVQQGDTMSRIANKFDVALEDLIAANAETIPDPDELQIGDQVIIPATDPDELPAASEIPAAN